MTPYVHLQSGLRECIRDVLRGEAHAARVNLLVAKCHALACAALNAKRGSNLLMMDHALDLSDLAYDCIAELFRRDENDQLVSIAAYFASYDIDRATDEDLLASLRRLVFSAVNQGLSHIYSNYDPSLGRVLRNIKIAIRSLATFNEVDRLGEPCIVPTPCDPLSHLVMADEETLRVELGMRVRGSEYIPGILAALARYLREQSSHSREVPTIRVALAIRWIYSSKRLLPEGGGAVPDGGAETGVSMAIRDACAEMIRAVAGAYAGRISAGELAMYGKIVEEYLNGKYLHAGGGSLFETFRSFRPDITRLEYRKYRSRLEYMARLADERLVKMMRGS